jgi:hypothetical protein
MDWRKFWDYYDNATSKKNSTHKSIFLDAVYHAGSLARKRDGADGVSKVKYVQENIAFVNSSIKTFMLTKGVPSGVAASVTLQLKKWLVSFYG